MSFVTPHLRTGSSDPEQRAGCGEVLLVCGDLGGDGSLLGFEGRDARGSAYERQKAAFMICVWEMMGRIWVCFGKSGEIGMKPNQNHGNRVDSCSINVEQGVNILKISDKSRFFWENVGIFLKSRISTICC